MKESSYCPDIFGGKTVLYVVFKTGLFYFIYLFISDIAFSAELRQFIAQNMFYEARHNDDNNAVQVVYNTSLNCVLMQ